MRETPKNFNRKLNPKITASNLLVLNSASDSVGSEASAYYAQVRSMPAANISSLSLSFGDGSNNIPTADMDTILFEIAAKSKSLDIRCILWCGHLPFGVSGKAALVEECLARPLRYTERDSSIRYDAIAGDIPPFFPFMSDYLDEDRMPQFYGLGYQQFASSSLSVPYSLRPPENYLDSYGADALIATFRLDCSPVASSDDRIPNASRINYIKKFIDDAAEAENAKYSNFGTVLLSGSGSGGGQLIVGLPEYYSAQSIPGTKLYNEQLRNEVISTTRNLEVYIDNVYRTTTGSHLVKVIGAGTTAGTEPTWNISNVGDTTTDGTVTFQYLGTIPADTFPGTNTALVPAVIGKTFNAIDNVYFRAVGDSAYYNRVTVPEQKSDIVYKTGAITVFSQSYGMRPVPNKGLDYFYDSPDIIVLAEKDALDAATADIGCTNVNNFSVFPFRFNRDTTGAPTSATVTVTALNTIVLKENAVTVATINVTGTLFNKKSQIDTALPANWTCILQDTFCESRAMMSLKNGACVSMGAAIEPFISGASKGGFLITELWGGANMAEAYYSEIAVTNTAKYNYIIGDPLYRPFGYRYV